MSSRDLSDEERKLFRDTMRSVTPLRSSNKKPLVHEPPPMTVKRSVKKSHDLTPTQYHLSNPYAEDITIDMRLSYCVANLPQKRLVQLRKGAIPWQARLDLHGHTVEQAKTVLCHFINQHEQTKHRCLLIIHGKGSSNGQAPILKNHVNHWLKQLPTVLAFHSALPKDGGTGALYVLLRRPTNE